MMMLRFQSVSTALSRKNTGAILLLLVSLIVSTIPCCDAKKDRNVAHGHRGKLRPYSPGPFAVKLTAADEATLRSGQPVTKQTVPDDPNAPGTVLCIQDVEAPVSAVWKQILDMDQYNKKVSKVTECKNYFVSKLSNGRVTIKTKQVLGVLPGYSVRQRKKIISLLGCNVCVCVCVLTHTRVFRPFALFNCGIL